jgi:hypothetical protein
MKKLNPPFGSIASDSALNQPDSLCSHLGVFFMKEIKLTRGYVAVVDDEDYNVLSKFKWQVKTNQRNNYAQRRAVAGEYGRSHASIIKMHRQILNVVESDPKSSEVDHIDGNGLNNQKLNLRFCTHSQNLTNQKKAIGTTSVYIGVHLDIRIPELSKPWRSLVKINGKIHRFGYFKTEVEAAIARERFITENGLLFHKLNF